MCVAVRQGRGSTYSNIWLEGRTCRFTDATYVLPYMNPFIFPTYVLVYLGEGYVVDVVTLMLKIDLNTPCSMKLRISAGQHRV